MFQGFKVSKVILKRQLVSIQEFKDSKIQKFKNLRIQEFKDLKVDLKDNT